MVIKVDYSVSPIYINTNVSPIYIKVDYGTGGGSGAVWGDITGTLSNQIDLQTALDGKFDDPTGTTLQYLRGDGSLATFPLTLPVLQEVRNQTGSTLSTGTVVYINGATGNKPTVAKAIATGDPTSAQTLGMISADILNNGVGYVIVLGTCSNLDTSAYTEGQQLYLSGTVAGGVTTTKPYAPIHLVYVGIVTRSHPTLGTVEVRVQNGYEMDELHNVSAQNPSNNDGLFYNTTTNLWEKKQISTALGYTPVPTTRTLTINGTGYDLSADRSWTIPSTNIYNSDGTLTGNRIITSNGKSLKILGGIQDIASEEIGLKLETSTTFMTAVIFELNNTYTTTGKKWQLRSLNNGDFDFANRTDSTSKIYIRANGKISLLQSTQISDAGLSINGATAIGGALQIQGGLVSPTGAGIELEYSGGIGYLRTYNRSAGYLPTEISGSKISLTQGNVIVGGTTDAGYKLDVQGTGRFTGNVTFGGEIFGPSNTYFNGPTINTGNLNIRYATINLPATTNAQILNVGDAFTVSGGNTTANITGTGVVSFRISNTTSSSVWYFENNRNAAAGSLEISNNIGTAGIVLFPSRSISIGSYTETGSALLSMTSTTKGFLKPRMTTTERNAIASPATGLSIYNTTTNTNDLYNGTSWISLASGNIYTTDGTLTGDRTVTSGGYNLTLNPKTFFDNGLTFNASPGNVGTFINTDSYSTISTQLTFYPNSGTNVAQTLKIIPKGTGFNSVFKAQFSVYNTDAVADPVNNEFVTFRAAGSLFTFASGKFGTGTIRPLMFSAGYATDSATNINQLYLSTGGNVIVGGSTDAGYKLDVQGTGRFTGAAGALTLDAVSAYISMNSNTNFVGSASNIIGGNTNGLGLRGGAIVFGTGSIGYQYFKNYTGLFYDGALGGIDLSTKINTSAALQVEATTKGFLPPRMTSTQRAAISTPAVGLIVYQTDATEGTYEYTSSGWRLINASGSGGGITRSVNSISSPTTAGATASTDYVYLVSGTTTLTLPTAVGNTNRYTVKNVGTNTVTINTTSSQTIDGSASVTIAVRYTTLDLISDGTNWNII